MIRQRSASDLPACVDALRRVHDADGYPMRWPDDPAAWLTPARLTHAWLAESAGSVLGHAVLTAADPTDAAVRRWLANAGGQPDAVTVLNRLFTTPAARGLGTARHLLTTATTTAASTGRRVVLDVLATDPAAAFYAHLGWHHLGTTTLQFADGTRHKTHCYANPADE